MSEPGSFHLRRPLGGTTLALVLLLTLSFLAAGSLESAYWSQNTMLHREYTRTEEVKNQDTVAIWTLISALLSLAAKIVFWVWVYRANKNCRGLVAGLRFTSPWAVGWFFVPFASLVFPCAVLQEIWKASTNPLNFFQEKASIVVGCWWAAWLFDGLGNLIKRFDSHGVRDRDHALQLLQTELWSAPAHMVMLAFTAVLVTSIYFKQKWLVDLAAKAQSQILPHRL